jgi:hypothetical protein
MESHTPILLICGDPDENEKPASYTMFVLPFAYRPERLIQQEPPSTYYVHRPASTHRQHYFTLETANVLYHRAKWLELEGHDKKKSTFVVYRGGRRIRIRMHAPRLVLFEWSEVKRPDPLRLGFLVQKLSFPELEAGDDQPGLDDLLQLNEQFRYWHEPFSQHSIKKGYKEFLRDCPVGFGEAQRIGECDGQKELYLKRWSSLLQIPVLIDNQYWCLFEPRWQQRAETWIDFHNNNVRELHETGWIAYADCRAFVWTCALTWGGCRFVEGEQARGHWVRLLNVDLPDAKDSGQSTAFERQWAKERTYDRWREWGSLYGFTYHSGAMLSSDIREPPLWEHFAENYFDQTLLLLYLRVVLFNFSRRLSELSNRARASRRGQVPNFQTLRWSFTLFTNLYQFPLLSNQQQAIEMYSLAREMMDVQLLFEEVEREIRGTHDYLLMEGTTRLTVVAAMAAMFGLTVGALGMNVFSEKSFDGSGWVGLLAVPLICIGLVMSFAYFHRFFARTFLGVRTGGHP